MSAQSMLTSKIFKTSPISKGVGSEVSDRILIFVAWLAVPALAMSLARIVYIGWKPLMIVPVAMTLIYVVVALLRRKISDADKALFILAGAYAIGVTSLLLYGHSANGSVFLISFSIMVFFYFEPGVGTLSVLLVGATEFILLSAQRSGDLDFTNLHALEPSPSILLASVIPYVLCGFVPLMVLRSVATKLAFESEQRSTELAALKNAEKEYQNVFERLERAEEIGRTGGWEVDLETGKVTWTRGTYLIHEIDPEDHAGFEKYLREQSEGATRSLETILPSIMKNDSSFELEMTFTTAKGRMIWVVTNGVSKVQNGKIVRVIGFTQDITARKLAEQKSAQLLKDLRRTEEIAGVGGWYMEMPSRQVTWTPGSYLIHDLDPSDPNAIEKYRPQLEQSWTPEVTRLAQAVIADHTPREIEHERVTAKCRKIWVLTRMEVVVRDGKVIGLAGHTQDITARKQAESQLRASQKMEAIGQLTAGIAHDFNNLLSVVNANLELMEEDAQGAPVLTKRIEAALRAVDRGAELTQHLLAFGRNQELSPKRLDLCVAVSHSAELMARTLPGSIAVQVMTDPEASIWAFVDEAQLENALLNLGLNARDAMPNGGALMFSVATRNVVAGEDEHRESVPPGCYAVITVQDTGKGMSAEVMAKAFDPFFTTKEIGQGTGLGLSMVYGFVRQSGGRVQLASTEGQGATFTLLLPLVDGAERDAKTEPSTEAVGGLTGRRRVLLVEDIEDVRKAISAQLEFLGLEVTTAGDATTALASLSSGQPFDLLLTDLGLQGAMDGDELAVHAVKKVPGIKVITMTGYNKDRVSKASFGLGVPHTHLRKPFKRSELKALLVTLFEK